MSILQYNGSGLIAMTGKNCVAICSDTRYGVQQTTIGTDFQRIYPMGERLYVGLSGLATDVQTLAQKLEFRLKLYELREERQIKPKAFQSLVSSMLYEKRFGPWFVEPVIAGLQEDGTPFISATDLIGAPVYTDDFVVAGTCSEQLYGMCEALYRKDMEPEDLFETISQALLAAVDRDCLAGWGGIVHIITPDEVITRKLLSRMD